MKIAVFHNYLDNIGGAEIVALSLARIFKADVYTTNINKEKIIKMGFSDVLPRIFSIGRLPKIAPFRQQLAFWYFRRLNLSGYYNFFIIAGDWAMSGSVNNRPNLWYVHSPLNELWAFRDYIRKSILSRWKVSPYDFWVWFNRKLTLKYSKSVDVWVANSENTKKRIKKFYKKEAEIIYPPIICSDYFPGEKEEEREEKKEEVSLKLLKSEGLPKDYWLSVNRLISHKRIEIQLKAFSNLTEENLVIVGSYEKGASQFENYKSYLESIMPSNVKIFNWLAYEDLKIFYQGAKGFITSAKDEDFGMTAVEAMAAGKPVIAPKEGGYCESVISGVGKLVEDIDEYKLEKAIRELSSEIKFDSLKYKENCLKRASDFDISKFEEKIRKLIKLKLI